MTTETIENRFTYHKPKEGQPEKYVEIRATAKDFANLVLNLCPDSQEAVHAIKKIEEAVFWANASIARHGK